MKNLHDIIQKNMEEFDEKFPFGILLENDPDNYAPEIKSHLLSSQLSIIQAIDEWAEDNVWNCGDRLSPENVVSLSDLRSFLKEAKTKLQ
jgi:hypothetical protein